MNGTPRMRSSFPTTPTHDPSASQQGRFRSSLPNLPNAPAAAASRSAPVISENLIDAPSQRMYTFAIYGILLAWRLYDWWRLVEDDTSSLAMFVKWTLIDIFFMFGVPFLRIPWLEWSDTTSFISCIIHTLLNGVLMFRVPIPIEGWVLMIVKTVFDREEGISEGRVSPASILHNSSLIMGKQIINILPEGSVTMNPNGLPFCIDALHPVVHIPLYFNQTKPKYVELLRIDLETNTNETIIVPQKEINRARKGEDDALLTMTYNTKKPGLYRLSKVIDQTRLEVLRRMSDTLVVACPKAVVKSSASNKCLGDLSDLTMEIEGTPPLKVVYSRTVNSDQSVHYFQNIQPENFVSPLLGNTGSGTLVPAGSQDVSWARSHRISVPLNESMIPGGHWLYSIEEIHDATGNIANFSTGGDDGEHVYPKGAQLEQAFTVHGRPVARLSSCDARSPIYIGTGQTTQMPVEYSSPGRAPEDTSHTLIWKFSPLEGLAKNGDHGEDVVMEEYAAKSAHNNPNIKAPGLYTLVGVKSRYCDGEIKEPASCLLLNPPEPELTISAENINDKCAGNSIGLLVDLDLIGTPPFVVRYDITTRGEKQSHTVKVQGLRHQLELKPTHAGHFKYQFTSIDDQVYRAHPLKDLTLEQDVKPPASAFIRRPMSYVEACIDQPVHMSVELSGEMPFTLEYELIHDGKRKKTKVTSISDNVFEISTDALLKGGEYSLALTSVQDNSGCKIFLNSEVEFEVRRQRPKASFGQLEGKYKTIEVEGRKPALPLRLTGRSPWFIKYRNMHDTSGKVLDFAATSNNDVLRVDKSGIYVILEVSDGQCPGTVDESADTFEVGWFPRPQIKLANTAVVIPEGDRFVKREVCEGDIDSVEVNLIGSSPYNVKYTVLHKPSSGANTIYKKEFEAALGSAPITMDTSKAGTYEYKFLELSDAMYDHDSKKFSTLILEQKVNKKPSASFIKPGQNYKYCKEELDGDEVIPIKLDGVPPFSLEIDIKHQSSSRPETVKVANIETNSHNFRIPHRVLSLGVHQVSVRKVRDSKGCMQRTDHGAPHVQVKVYDVPTIYSQNSRKDYCVGERISYTLSGTAPFEIFYTFDGVNRKAKSTSTTFRRIAEKPGNFTITGLSDKASECKAGTHIEKTIHPMPSVKISKGRQIEVDIHEGSEAPISFEFWGTPPFEFTYTRSTNARKGVKSTVLETRHEISYEHSMTIRSSQEGTYEVVAIKDKYCSFSTVKDEGGKQKLLQF